MSLLDNILSFFSKTVSTDQQPALNVSSGNPVAAFEDNQDLIDGLKFRATLQLRTPLRVLLLDGKQHNSPDILPDTDVEPWQGAWVPILKPWKELGINLDVLPESASASEIGLIHRSTYLPFLLAMRKQVEGEGSISHRIEKLRVELQKLEWSDFVKRHQGADAIVDKFFPLFIETLPGITAAVKDQLRFLDILTAEQLSSAKESLLLSIKGVGKAKAASLKEYASGITDNRSSDRLENLA